MGSLLLARVRNSIIVNIRGVRARADKRKLLGTVNGARLINFFVFNLSLFSRGFGRKAKDPVPALCNYRLRFGSSVSTPDDERGRFSFYAADIRS